MKINSKSPEYKSKHKASDHNIIRLFGETINKTFEKYQNAYSKVTADDIFSKHALTKLVSCHLLGNISIRRSLTNGPVAKCQSSIDLFVYNFDVDVYSQVLGCCLKHDM